jgi:hypothetical protein
MSSEFTKQWIIEKGVPIVESYGGNITLRALHYKLVGLGMTNDIPHYKKVVSAMYDARWEGLLPFDAFVDLDRGTVGETSYKETDVDSSVDEAKRQIKAWATSYHKNRWSNQPYYPEVFIEKKALQYVFQDPCNKWDVALNPCKGYPSLTFLYDAKNRFQEIIDMDKKPIILYFGDYDCSGEDIPRSIADTLTKMGVDVEVRRILLMEDQVVKWHLPPAPSKVSDTRSRSWDGLGQVELDAVDETKIVSILNKALGEIFDKDLYSELTDIESEEQYKFKKILKRDFKKLLD